MTELEILSLKVLGTRIRLNLKNGDHVIIDPMELFSDIKEELKYGKVS